MLSRLSEFGNCRRVPYLFDQPPWALINFLDLENGRLFEVGANSRLGAYSNKYGITRINNFNYASPQPVLTNQKHVVELLHTIDLKIR